MGDIIMVNIDTDNIFLKEHKFIDDKIIDCLNRKKKVILLLEPIDSKSINIIVYEYGLNKIIKDINYKC
jgi:hypothetical protein